MANRADDRCAVEQEAGLTVAGATRRRPHDENNLDRSVHAIVGFATTAIIAQTTSSPQSNSSSGDRQITVTGCLKESPASSATTSATGAASTAGTAGTTGTAATGTTGETSAVTQTFLLTNATASSGETSGDAAAPATVSPSAVQTYRLIANPEALSPHVGKKLELIGTLEKQDSTTRTTEPAAGSEGNAPTLRVKAGKIMAASCSQ